MQTKRQLSFALTVGLCRGATGAAVDHLQAFLRRFGYLHVAPEGDPYAAVRAISRPPTAKPGVFDDETVVALCNYQQFHRLPITGRLDLATVAHMSRPRCGFPDIPPASGSSKFATLGSRWRRNDLTFGLQNFTPDLTQEEVRNAIVTALGLWSHVTPLTFREVEDNPDILIRFVAGDHDDGAPFDGSGNALAHAFPPPSNGGDPAAGDVHFDEAENWIVNLIFSIFGPDLVTIAAHEFGHSLGLDHTTVDGALMEAVYSGPHRYLAQDDISGIQSIYGPRLVERGNLLHLSGVTTDGHLWHTIRFPSNEWAPFGDVERQAGDHGFILDVDLQSVSNVVHLCAINSSGDLWHTIRRTDGWAPFGNVEGQTGDRGTFVRVGIAEVNGELHVCGVTSDGHLWHTIRRADSWLPFGDVEGQAGDRGAFVDIDCAGINGELHVCGVTSNGHLWHTIRRADGSWFPFGDVEGQTGDRGIITEVACAGVAGELHVCSVTSDGHLWHTIRRADGWLPFGDVEGQTGNRGSFVRVSAGESGGELHVCGVTSDGHLWHTIRRADGWLPFGNVEGQTGDRGSFRTVSADGIFIL